MTPPGAYGRLPVAARVSALADAQAVANEVESLYTNGPAGWRWRNKGHTGSFVGGGVARTLALDAHGQSLSSALLEMEIDEAVEVS